MMTEGGSGNGPAALRSLSRLGRGIVATNQIVASVELAVVSVLISVIFLLVVLQVASRHLMEMPIFWFEEVAQMSLVWVTFIGGAYATATRSNLTVTMVSEGFGETWKRITFVICEVLIICCAVVLIEPGARMAAKLSHSYATASGVPRGITYLSVTVGFVLVIGHSLLNIAATFLAAEDRRPAP